MKEKIYLKEGEFTDYKGLVHKFIVAAVSIPEETAIVEVGDDIDYEEIDCPKSVRIGVAICNPKDEYDKELGAKIAINKARKATNYALYATLPGMINTAVVEALVDQEVKFIIGNPSRVIPGYYEEKKRWEAKKAFQAEIDALSEEDKKFYEELTSDQHKAVWKMLGVK